MRNVFLLIILFLVSCNIFAQNCESTHFKYRKYGETYYAKVNTLHGGSPNDTTSLISIYKGKILIKEYKLSQLICKFNVETSTLGFRWLFNDKSFRLSKNILSLTTFELVTYNIDIINGEIISKKKSEKITTKSIYAYGKIKNIGSGIYELDICHLVYGKVENSKIRFKADKSTLFQTDYSTVLVNEGVLMKIDFDIHKIMLNACTFDLIQLEKQQGIYIEGKYECKQKE
jgi:hypothetical protein